MRLLRFLVVLAIPLAASILACGSEDSPAQNPAAPPASPNPLPQNPGAQNPNNPQNPAGANPQGQGVGQFPNDPRIRDPQIPPLGIPNQDNDGNNNAGNRPIWNVPPNPGQIPGGGIREDAQIDIPNLAGNNNGNAWNRFGNANPSPSQIPGGIHPGGIQPASPGSLGEVIEAQRQEAIANISLLPIRDGENASLLMGDSKASSGVLNVMTYAADFSPRTDNFLTVSNATDISRDVMDYHRDQAILRGVSVSPNGSFYAQCVRRVLGQDFQRASTKCQINAMLPARPELRQVEFNDDISDLIIDDQRNLSVLGRKNNADDPFVRVFHYNYATQQTTVQVLGQNGAQLNGESIQGSFELENLYDAKLFKENGRFYFAFFQKRAADSTGLSYGVSLYICNEQNGIISSNCVRREIMREGGLLDTRERSQFFYYNVQMRFENHGFTLMNSLFYRGSGNKEIIYYNLALNNPNQPGAYFRFPYQADTQYAFVDWLHHPQDQRDFFMCGLRTIRGGSGTFQVDCWTASYANGNQGVHDRYDDLLRYMPSSQNTFYLMPPIGQRGPVLYVTYPMNVDLEGDMGEGILVSLANFVRAHAGNQSKVLRIEFAPFQNL